MVRRRTAILVLLAALLLVTGSLCAINKLHFAGCLRGKDAQQIEQQIVREKLSVSSDERAAAIECQWDLGKESRVELLSCTPSETRLRFHLGEVTIQAATMGDSAYSVVKASGCAVTSRAGEPERGKEKG